MKTRLLKSVVIAVLIAISTNVHAFTAVVSGAWTSATTWGGIAPGAMVSNQDIIIPTGITVDLDIDVTFSGLINSFNVDGTLNSGSNKSVDITLGSFTGTGSVIINRLSFDGLLTTATFSGSMDLNTLRNMGSAITMSAQANVADSLDLEGGSIILATGSNLSLLTNAVVRVNDGTLTTSGGLFTTGAAYDVWYVGTTKSTGLEINSLNLRNLHFNLNDNLQIVTSGMTNLVINGTLDMSMGQFDISNDHLTVVGDIQVISGSLLITTASTDITVTGNGPTTDGLRFATAASVGDIEIDRTGGSCKLGTTVTVTGTLFLTEGDFLLNNGALIMGAGSTIQVGNGNLEQTGGSFDGTASYDVDYIGGSHTADLELSGSGLNDVMVGMQSASDTLILDNDIMINGNLDMSLGMMSLDGNDLTLDGTFDQNASAYFIGDSASTMTLNLTSVNDTIYFGGNGKHLDGLEINIGTATILLASDLTIHNSLDLTAGKIEITNSSLHFRSSASVNGANATRYIVTSGSGQVEMNVNSNSTFVTFPIGTTNDFTPAYIQQTSTGNSGLFKVRAMNGVFAQGTTGFNSATTESVVNNTWVINAAAAVNVNMNLKLGWEVTDETNGFNRNQAHIAHYMNNMWDSYATSAAVAGPNGTYEITRTGITALSPFAVVDTAAVLGLNNTPAITAAINVYPNPTADVVTVETSEMHANYLYQVYDATGNLITSASNANAVNKFNLEAYSNGFYFLRITNTDTNATITKRIVKNN
ncbi:MAG: T9SS type A sorting domain-containing protein [Bacteroidota bacterium]|nr:T9SS type A sorting domain-containing protein [Bacteroidota bacterium]